MQNKIRKKITNNLNSLEALAEKCWRMNDYMYLPEQLVLYYTEFLSKQASQETRRSQSQDMCRRTGLPVLPSPLENQY